MSSDWNERLQEEVDLLKRTRDELSVQLHLGAAEARDAWERLEASWQKLEGRLHRVDDATHDAAEDVGSATQLLVDELKQGYERIKQAL